MAKKTKTIFVIDLPSPNDLPQNSILIFDKNLLKNKYLKVWLRNFPYTYPVQAGEDLKQLKSFETHIKSVLNISAKIGAKDLTLVAVGGGSVGDFVGFTASVFKRGVGLIHIPSTWLAAIDSAHGGKTALNIAGVKNQIGTFYPAEKVILSKQLLLTQPTERTEEALGEVLKTALLSGGSLWTSIQNESLFTGEVLWEYLPQLISYKLKIVQRDPFEKIGIRYFLNLGHTYGHAFESLFNLPHGVAINYGLRMALDFSFYKGLISRKEYNKIQSTTFTKGYLFESLSLKTLLKNKNALKNLITKDKKIADHGMVNFVFLKKPGSPVVLKTSVEEIMTFAKNYIEIMQDNKI